jgi:hypothetical protein
MYPEIIVWWTSYLIDQITPLIGLLAFIVVLYKITKSQGFRFRDIVSKLPMIIIGSLLAATYTNFIFQSGHIFPTTRSQFASLLSLSVWTIDFVWLIVGWFITTLIATRHMPHKTKSQWWYVLILTYLYILIPLGILYTFWDSVIGKFNQWFFSIGSFAEQSRIGQLGGSVYPIGLLISARSALCVWVARYFYHRYPKYIWYLIASLFLLWYVVILHYQHYPRHLIVNLWSFQMDLRSYCCIAIACISWCFGYKKAIKK